MANNDRPAAAGESDPEFDAAAIEAGRLLFARECQFIFGAASLVGLYLTYLLLISHGKHEQLAILVANQNQIFVR